MNQNKSILICGRLGQNPDLRYTRKQEPVCTFSLAENIEGSDKPKWHKVVVWGKQAENCNLHLKKGLRVFVQGQNERREFENLEGEVKQFTQL
ncbi:MAG: single-stranded DNA-binding protein [Bacteriovoracaceae bacterium]|nr:single-stranded DNA-binding protein [Bacteriovoracaceae bacterium]